MGESPAPFSYAEPQLDGLNNNLSSVADEQADNSIINGEEEPYTIKCICRFPEDDGNTVLCEQCNTWQHIECYYRGAPVPDVHQCSDCSPRHIDANWAALRQRQLRDAQKLSDDRKSKRPGPKSHKKSRTKDTNNVTVQTNGWPTSDKEQSYATDRKRASPKDQQPPAKRPKTVHRTSGSMNSHTQDPRRPSNHRNRSGSNVASTLSPTKSPVSELPPDYYSPEFIRIHQENTEYKPAQNHLYLDIKVVGLLNDCLNDPETFAAATNGRSATDFLKRYPQPIEELFTPVRKQIHEDTSQWFHGSHPRWPILTVEHDVVHSSLIGELKGHVGHRDNYKADPVNRWTTLRHPDHFVFFHPVLPIYIDARTEGTELRYVRRSCRPNSSLETIITGERDYRFCLMATRDLQAGEEVTIKWDTESYQELFECLSKLSATSATDSQREYINGWVEGLLANFGGCACDKTGGQECLMARFDRRIRSHSPTTNGRYARMKSKKTRKRSSPGIGQTNPSRASSETLQRGDVDEDVDDTRSTTHSSRSRNSRDVSPFAQISNDALQTALSEREKRKLQQQEKLFEQLEQQEMQEGQRKKKRISGSSTNTPVTSISQKQIENHSSTGSNPTTPAPSSKNRYEDGKTTLYFGSPTLQNSSDRTIPGAAFGIPRQAYATGPGSRNEEKRPVYVDAFTQTPEDVGFGNRHSPSPRKPYISLTQRLLRRSHLAKLAATGDEDEQFIKSQTESLTSGFATEKSSFGLEQSDSIKNKSAETPENVLLKTEEVTQQPSEPVSPTRNGEKEAVFSGALTAPVPITPAHPLIKPPPPPWPPSERLPDSKMSHVSSPSMPTTAVELPRNTYRATDLHVDLPPPLHFNRTMSNEAGISGTPGSLSASISQSPTSADASPIQGPLPLIPLISGPGGLAQPSPIKKKMSLSDYMKNKKKADTPVIEKEQQKLSQSHTEDGSSGSKGLPQQQGKENASHTIDDMTKKETSTSQTEAESLQNQVTTFL